MRGIPVLLRRPPWGAAFLVPALGTLFAAAAMLATVVLLDREDSWRTRQLAIVRVRDNFDTLQASAWTTMPDRAGIASTEARLVVDLRGLGLGSAVPLARANFRALAPIVDLGPSQVLSEREAQTYGRVVTRLDDAARAAGAAADRADTISLAGSGSAILLLLIGFWLLHARLRRAHDHESAQRAALEVTLDRLQLAQRDRRALLSRAVDGAEEERRRIASDLHDGPIQRLTATALSLDLLANRVSRGNFESVEVGLRDVRDALAAQMISLRRLMAELRPPVLDEGGVGAAIANSAARALPPSVTCAVHDRTSAARFAPELETAAYRVVGEALSNVAKHARASRVDVYVERLADELFVAVVDDGVGFEPGESGGRIDHLGLVGMRERVEGVGGRLRITSGPGAGTRVEARIPWRPAETNEVTRAVA